MTDQKPPLTRENIIGLARQIADPDTADPLHNDMITLMVWELERFVDKVAERAAAAEREACEQAILAVWSKRDGQGEDMCFARAIAAIRARGAK